MLRDFYHRILALAGSPRASWWLAGVAFAEASFFPVPPDALLIPMALARPERAWRFALVCTIASVAGGALGYFIGFAVFDVLAKPVLEFYGYGEKFAAFQAMYSRWGLWVILIKGLTPIPYKIVTIASGAAKFNCWLFMAASAVTRGARFFIVATLLHFWGERVKDFIERRLTLVTTGVAMGVIGGFLVLRLL
jgi:membrane protein YqaA with SNARE-associated domain